MMINCLGGWVGLYVWRHYVIKSNNNLYFVKFLVAIDCRLSSPWQKCKFLVYFVCICWALFLLSMFLSFITWQLWISRWLLALAVALALDSFGFDCLYFAFDAYACLSIFFIFLTLCRKITRCRIFIAQLTHKVKRWTQSEADPPLDSFKRVKMG